MNHIENVLEAAHEWQAMNPGRHANPWLPFIPRPPAAFDSAFGRSAHSVRDEENERSEKLDQLLDLLDGLDDRGIIEARDRLRHRATDRRAKVMDRLRKLGRDDPPDFPGRPHTGGTMSPLDEARVTPTEAASYSLEDMRRAEDRALAMDDAERCARLLDASSKDEADFFSHFPDARRIVVNPWSPR